MKDRDRIRSAKNELAQAEGAFEAVVRDCFPVGAHIHSGKSGRGIVACEVLRHGHGDRLFVRSQTGREYWITAYHVVEAGLNDDLAR